MPALTRDELLAFAAGARAVMIADGEVSEGELDLAARFGARLGLTPDAWRAAWDEAIRLAPRPALEAVTRPEARETVYELLYALASDRAISDPEWDLLEWLDEAWRA